MIASLGGRCTLVAHDWGAVVAWHLAASRPELIAGLVIINLPHPAAIAREVRRSMRQKLKLTYQLFFQLPLLPELAMRCFGRMLLRRSASFTEKEVDDYARQWKASLTPMLNYYRALPRSREEARRSRKRIEMPTLIIWGDNEPVFLDSALENIGEWVPDVRIERLPGIGHFAQRDAPERVTDLIVRFAKRE